MYDNYVEFVERTGHQPVRMVVEQNIQDLANRIREVAYDLLVLIQKRWRGIMARRSVAYFRTEIVRLRQNDVAYVMKIQRMYRGHWCRRFQIPKLTETQAYKDILASYLREQHAAHEATFRRDLNNRILVEYRTARRNEATLRYTSRIRPASDFNGRKMKAYESSCYCSDDVTKRVVQSIRIDEERNESENRARGKDRIRKQFIASRIREYGPRGFGLRSEPRPSPPRIHTMSSSLCSNVAREHDYGKGFNTAALESSRSRGMRAYFHDELMKLVEDEMQLAAHNFDRPNLLSRFQEFNKNKTAKNAYVFPQHLMTESVKELLKEDEDQDMRSTHRKRVSLIKS